MSAADGERIEALARRLRSELFGRNLGCRMGAVGDVKCGCPLCLTDLLASTALSQLSALSEALSAAQRQLAEQRAELEGRMSEEFRSIPSRYDTPEDHYREMARRFNEDRDEKKHALRKVSEALTACQQERDTFKTLASAHGCFAAWEEATEDARKFQSDLTACRAQGEAMRQVVDGTKAALQGWIDGIVSSGGARKVGPLEDVLQFIRTGRAAALSSTPTEPKT